MMLHTTTVTSLRSTPQPPMAPPAAGRIPDPRAGVAPAQREAAVDEAIAESFPASDPPPWNPGIARTRPGGTRGSAAAAQAAMEPRLGAMPGVIDLSRPRGSAPTLRHSLISAAGAGGLVLLVPAAILLVGLPLALAVRGLVEGIGFLLSLIR